MRLAGMWLPGIELITKWALLGIFDGVIVHAQFRHQELDSSTWTSHDLSDQRSQAPAGRDRQLSNGRAACAACDPEVMQTFKATRVEFEDAPPSPHRGQWRTHGPRPDAWSW